MISSQRRRLLCLWILSVVAPAVAAQDDTPSYDAEAVAEARDAFVATMVRRHGFDAAELEATLAGIDIVPNILAAIARPAERVVPWHEYRGIFLTDERIRAGVDFWNAHEAELATASSRYGVAPEIIVAIIGVETYFGQRMGSYRVLDALGTLAFAYPPRAKFFAGELESFLLLSREEGEGWFDAVGSYAGAMGAGQFIPSSFRAYAVDGDGDGRRDLWSDWDDILASVANYFEVHGWREGGPVAAPVELTGAWDGHMPENSLDLNHTAGELGRLGYAFDVDVADDAPATIMALEAAGGGEEYWVGFHNFYVITRYNRSVKYALAAHQLSQAIVERRGVVPSRADTGSGAP